MKRAIIVGIGCMAAVLGFCFLSEATSTDASVDLEKMFFVEASEMGLPESAPPADIGDLEAPEEIIGEEVLEEGTPFKVSPEGYVSLIDFQDVDIRVVLRMFSKRFNINIVPSPLVQGTVSIRLANVYWEKALKTILDMHKLIMQYDEDIIKVLTPEEVEMEPLQVRVYTLGYTNAAESKGIIEDLLTERGQINVDTASNKLIISDVPTQFQTIEKVIDELDKQTPQILIEMQILEKEANKGENIGIKWDFMKEYKVGFTDIARSYTKSEFMVTDTTEKQSIVQSFTSHPAQVDNNKDNRNVSASYENSKVVKRLGEDASTPESTFRHMIKTATMSPADFSLTLSALLDRTDVEILSQPRITTVDNRAAEIKVVQSWPIPNYTFNSDTGRWEVSGFDYKDIGIILNVTPHINKDNYITLDVKPEVSKTDKSLIFGGGEGSSAEIPIIDIRTTTTRVIVRSGETLVIGGLITSDTIEVVNKVPLLGDLPLLGVLFRHKSTSVKTKDLMIFITPTIVSEDQ